MKFVCDRCKTRYSIGDDRVRGKILKIRCKNCANVITVREGMGDLEASVPPAPGAPGAMDHAARAKKSTTIAPEALLDERREAALRPEPLASAVPRAIGATAKEARAKSSTTKAPAPSRLATGSPSPEAAAAPAKRAARSDDPGRPLGAKRGTGPEVRGPDDEPNTLGAAFASAMAKPPSALEEEWYVSIDGNQAGPFSLVEAQGWITQKPFDAELHCWSEGFDDWLPVDKVGHFRGLRKRPAPPPLPRIGNAPRASLGPSAPSPPIEGDPKPLFAATMASIERGAPGLRPGASPGTSPGAGPGAGPGAPLPSSAPPARATPPFGTPIQSRPNGAQAPLPLRAGDARPALMRPPSPQIGAVHGGPRVAPFDMSDDNDPHSELEATRFRDPIVGSAAQATDAGLDAIVTAAASDFESDAHLSDDLDIGEVSRVVKLADLAPRLRASAPPSGFERPGSVVARPPGAGGLVGGATATHRAVTPGLHAQAGAAPGMAPSPPELDPSGIAPAAQAHRRGLVALLSVAGVMLLGVTGAVVLLVTISDDPTGGDLGPVHNIDTSRPEDPITHRPIEPVPAPTQTQVPPPRSAPHLTRPTPIGASPPPREAEAPTADSLRSDEIEEGARKHQDMTQRCYLRSQRGADAILVGDVKKIAVTLTVDKDGSVTDLQLSDHAADNLGKCLTTSIKSWKFRSSPGGTFKFSLNFVSG